MEMSSMLPLMLMSQGSGSNGTGSTGSSPDMSSLLQMMMGGGPVEEDEPLWSSGVSLGTAPDRTGQSNTAFISIAVMPPTMQRSKASLRISLQTASSSTTVFASLNELPRVAAWLKQAPNDTLGQEGKEFSLSAKLDEAKAQGDQYAEVRQMQNMMGAFE